MHKKNLDGNSSMAIFFVHRAKVFYNNIFLQMLTIFNFNFFFFLHHRNDVVGFCWIWSSSFYHDAHYPHLRLLGIPVTGEPWCLDDLCTCSFRLLGHTGRIRFISYLQILWWREMEAQRSFDVNVLSWVSFMLSNVHNIILSHNI